MITVKNKESLYMLTHAFDRLQWALDDLELPDNVQLKINVSTYFISVRPRVYKENVGWLNKTHYGFRLLRRNEYTQDHVATKLRLMLGNLT